jgi:hypothetical protein
LAYAGAFLTIARSAPREGQFASSNGHQASESPVIAGVELR